MDWAGWALFGLVATAALTVVMVAAQLAGLTRLDLPLLLGTIVTADPDRARVAGFFIHLAIGLGFALGYAAGFALLDEATWWLGGLFGLLHVAVALTVLVPLLPGVHPRIASDRAGPTTTAVLEPPGLAGLNYGRQTPSVAIVAHLVYGIALGVLSRRTEVPRPFTDPGGRHPARSSDRGLRAHRRHTHRSPGLLRRCHRLDVRAPLRRPAGVRPPRRRVGRRDVPVGSGGRSDRHRAPLPAGHRQPGDHVAHRTWPPDAPRRDDRQRRRRADADDPARSPADRRGRPGRGRRSTSILASANDAAGLARSTVATSWSATGRRRRSPCAAPRRYRSTPADPRPSSSPRANPSPSSWRSPSANRSCTSTRRPRGRRSKPTSSGGVAGVTTSTTGCRTVTWWCAVCSRCAC